MENKHTAGKRARMSKRYIEVEAFISSEQEIYCKDCARRKGIKNGKERFCYEIGDAPCRACGIMDVLDDVEAYSEAFPADAKPVVWGDWVKVDDDLYWCSHCHSEIEMRDIYIAECRYCPVCGADMRKEKDDER